MVFPDVLAVCWETSTSGITIPYRSAYCQLDIVIFVACLTTPATFLGIKDALKLDVVGFIASLGTYHVAKGKG